MIPNLINRFPHLDARWIATFSIPSLRVIKDFRTAPSTTHRQNYGVVKAYHRRVFIVKIMVRIQRAWTIYVRSPLLIFRSDPTLKCAFPFSPELTMAS